MFLKDSIFTSLALAVALLALLLSVISLRAKPSAESVEVALASDLAEHERLLAKLDNRGAGSQGSAAISTYLDLARKNGVASQTALKSDLNELERNTMRIIAYLDLYESGVSDAKKINVIRATRSYAISLLDREDALLELYMLGGGYSPTAPIYSDELRKLVVR